MTGDTGPSNLGFAYWRVLLTAGASFLLVVVIYFDTFSRLVSMWKLSSYQHGWLVYPLSFYLLWWNRRSLAGLKLTGSLVGVAALCACVLLWIVAWTISVQVLEFLAISLMVPTTFWAIGGTVAMRGALFPFLLLVASVPTGEFLVRFLVEVTADISTFLLKGVGIPAYRDGLFLTLPGGSFEVADVCSGLRYLLAGVTAALAYCYVTFESAAKRFTFIIATAIAMVIGNGVRAFIVMAVASSTEMRVLGGEDHVIFGMFFFAAIFMALVWLGENYSDSFPARRSMPATHRTTYAPVIYGLVAVAALSLGPILRPVEPSANAIPTSVPPLPELQSCPGPFPWDSSWEPELRGADSWQSASYQCEGGSVGVYIASYGSPARRSELDGSVGEVWPAAWHVAIREQETGTRDVAGLVATLPDSAVHIWYAYHVGDRLADNPFEAKLLEAVYRLLRRPVRSNFIVFTALEQGDHDPRADMHSVAEEILHGDARFFSGDLS